MTYESVDFSEDPNTSHEQSHGEKPELLTPQERAQDQTDLADVALAAVVEAPHEQLPDPMTLQDRLNQAEAVEKPKQDIYEQFNRYDEKLSRLGFQDAAEAEQFLDSQNVNQLRPEAQFALSEAVRKLRKYEKLITDSWVEQEKNEMAERLESMGIDSMTGAMTKDRFESYLRAEFGISYNDREFRKPNLNRASEKKPANMGVLFMDLSGFKGINDNFGHEVGDAVLGQTAALVDQVKRQGDVFARVGGDEFVVMMKLPEDMPSDEIQRITNERAEDFRRVLSQPRTEDPAESVKNGRQIQPAVSIGASGGRVANLNVLDNMTEEEKQSAITFFDLKKAADQDMYTAKEKMKAADPTIEKYSRQVVSTERPDGSGPIRITHGARRLPPTPDHHAGARKIN